MVRRIVSTCCLAIALSSTMPSSPSTLMAQGRALDTIDRESRSWRPSRPALYPQCGDPSHVWWTPCYDEGRTLLYCPYCGAGAMHGCPDGFAMSGAGSGNNLFHCSPVGPYSHTYFEVSGGTQRHESIACALGYFMIGMHEENNVLQCASIGRPVVSEYRTPVGAMTTCSSTWGQGVITGWNRQGRYMLCSVLR